MTDASGVWIVLPAYNEAAGLPELLRAAEAVGRGAWHVVVVDDGSQDGTADAARAFAGRLPVHVLTHAQNRGLAAAIRTGLEHAARAAAPGDAIVTMDADNTHRPEQIPDLLAALRGGAEVVIASRYAPGARQAGVPRHRALLAAGVGWLLRRRFHLSGVRDYSCGYRAYRASLLQRAMAVYGDRFIEARGFVVMTELLVKLARFGPRVVEVPLDLRYDRKVGASKMPTAATIAAYLRLMATAGPAARRDA